MTEEGFREQGLVEERRKDLVTRLGKEVVAGDGVEEGEQMLPLTRRHVGESLEGE